MEDVASLSHVTLRYESGAQALEDVSLVVRPGERVCVLGSNGSGKSTLASVLCGLLAPDSGTVTLLGERVFDSERTEPIDFAAYQRARQSLGLVFQNPDDQIVTTVVEDDVAFGPENLGVAPDEITVRVERELRRVAMTDYAKADPTKLSGGQKQRVAIAGALAMEPQVIVFDEPGSLLDVRGRRAIMRVMGRLASDGATIVHITHFMEEALEADRVVVLERGRIVLEGSPQEVFCHADKIVQLGLEEPFVARLARRLDLPWTCDKDALAQAIAARLGPKGSTPFGPEPKGSTPFGPEPKGSTPFGPGSPVAKGALPDATALPVIDVSHVSFSYRSDRKALDDVSFAVTAGSSVAIVGQTGSGKSTLLRLLCALEVPDAGELQVNGVSTRRKRDRRKLHGTIGYVMQHPERQLFAETVMQDVAFGPTNMGLSAEEVARRCRAALDLVGLVGYDNASPFELSGGQQRLCAIAGILAMWPRIIVLDEPTAGLDPRGRAELRAILEVVKEQGVTVVQVTHNMDDAARADRVIVLNQARVMLDGTPHEVFCSDTSQALRDAGLGVPAALEWAQRLGLAKQPLTLDELVECLTNAEEKRPEAPIAQETSIAMEQPEPTRPAAADNDEAVHHGA